MIVKYSGLTFLECFEILFLIFKLAKPCFQLAPVSTVLFCDDFTTELYSQRLTLGNMATDSTLPESGNR